VSQGIITLLKDFLGNDFSQPQALCEFSGVWKAQHGTPSKKEKEEKEISDDAT
jgi:hypothetical protein